MKHHRPFLCSACFVVASGVIAQLLPEQRFLYPQLSDGYAVFDSDGDGDMDIARSADGTLVLHEQYAPGSFRVVHVLGSCRAYDIRTADIDADGVTDVVAGDVDADRIRWAKGLGGGAYLPLQDLVSGTPNPYDVHVTDLDGDGDLDLLHADGAVSTGYRWNANLGAGSFGPSTLITSAAGASSTSPRGNFIAVGDVDLDGDADLAMAGPSFAWWENDGSGSFTVHTLPALPAAGAEPLFTDLDGDGDPDLVVTYAVNMTATATMAALLNLGNSTFGPIQVLQQVGGSSYNTYVTGARPADVNGDGDLDLVMSCELGANNSNCILTLNNDGLGGFPTMLDVFHALDLQSFTTGDVDGDGQDDIVSCSNRGPHVRFASNAPIAPLGSVGSPARVVVLNTNNDAFPEVLTLCSAYGWGWFTAEGDDPLPAGLHLNLGNGLLSDATLCTWTSRSALSEADAGDLDGDGDDDVAAMWGDPISGSTKKVMVMRTMNGVPDSSGQIGQAFTVVPSVMSTPWLRDLDQDGDLDINRISLSGPVGVFTAMNLGNAFFGPEQLWSTNAPAFALASTTCDVDVDGDADLVVMDPMGGPLSWAPNNGLGGFGSFQSLLAMPIPFNVDAVTNSPIILGVDLTNDGWEDLVAFTGDSIAVLLNNAGTWNSGQTFSTFATAYAVGDIDNSGSPDLVAIRSDREVVTWLNMGLGVFAPELLLADQTINSGTDHLALADMDNDGLLDVVTCSANGHSAAWMRNGGNIGAGLITAPPIAPALQVFPVPMRDHLHVTCTQPVPGNASVQVLDVRGRILRTLRGNGTNTLIIDRGDLAPGLYVLRVDSLGAVRFVVE